VLGLRGPLVDHTRAEAELIQRYAAGARGIVEIGVFEGGTAAALRQVMDRNGTLVLIDPYPHGCVGVNMASLMARRVVRGSRRGDVAWIRKLSEEAARGWSSPIDFLAIDGVHNLEGVQADWSAWSKWVEPEGHVALRHVVAPAAIQAVDRSAKADEIVPWILANYPEWELVTRQETTAVLRRARG
jgi:predicted O-methyltransferase YrrM